MAEVTAVSSIPFHDDIVATIVKRPGVWVVHAPRGYGKTRILADIRSRLAPTAVHVSGRDGQVAVDKLWTLETGDSPILLDDVDHLLQVPGTGPEEQLEEGAAPGDTGQTAETHLDQRLELLWALKRHVTSSGRWLCMTTSHSPLTLADYRREVSDVLMQADNLAIEPRRVHWKRNVRETVDDLYASRKSVRIWGRDCCIDDNLIDRWCDVAQKLTGAHPTLLDPAVQLLFTLLEAGSESDKECIECGDKILEQALTADLARAAVPYIQKRLASLSARETPEGLEALSWLARLAQVEIAEEQAQPGSANDPPGSLDVPALVEARLHTEGLAHFDVSEGRFRIVGTLIRDQMLALQVPQKRGRNRVMVQPKDGPVVELELPARLLSLFEYLAARNGEFVSTTDLVRVSGLRDEASVRTALHRLIKVLKDAGVGEVMENVYRKGYRLVMKSYTSFGTEG